jgi:hypothetical protein
MADFKEYEAFGKQLADLEVSSKDLENRINGLGHVVDDKAIKALVTGYVDGLLGKQYHERESYELVHGFARFLYNGDFQDVRGRVLNNFAKQALRNKEDSDLLEFLRKKNDTAALAIIAEKVLDTNPELTERLYREENRPAILQKIIDTHRSSKQWKETVSYCMTELKDTEGMLALAREHINDVAFAQHIFERNSATRDDWTLAANTWQDKNIAAAYYAVTKACWAHPRPKEVEQLRDELKQQFISKEPLAAMQAFKDENRFNRDKDALTAIGKQLMAKGEYSSALDAFAAAEYEGPEFNTMGLEKLKMYAKDPKKNLKSYDYERFVGLMHKAAPAYFEQGGSPSIASDFIHAEGTPDALNRKLAYALAGLPKKKDSWNAHNAYARLITVKEKTAKDEQVLDTLRGRMIAGEISYADSVFIGHKDHKALQMMLEKRKDLDDEHQYNIARELNDNALLEKTRTAIVNAGVQHALYVFGQAKDDAGITYARKHIAHGVDMSLVDKILPPEKKSR